MALPLCGVNEVPRTLLTCDDNIAGDLATFFAEHRASETLGIAWHFITR